MSLTGTLGIDIRLNGGGRPDVRFVPARPVPAGRLLAGLAPAEASQRLRSLFSVCGNAHAVALALACEAVAGTAAAEPVQEAREVMVCAEALREHAVRILSDWPQLCDMKPEVAGLRVVSDAFRQVQAAAGDGIYLTGVSATADIVPLRAAARLLAEECRSSILRNRHQSVEAAIRLHQAAGDLPAIDDPAEDTVYGRRMHDPRLEGRGVERRVKARLLEVEALCAWLEHPGGECPLGMAAASTSAGCAIAGLDVARGRLVHELQLKDGVLTNYRIAAPTTQNFAPGGAAETAIGKLDARDGQSLQWLARLVVLEIDPCVAHDVRFS